jgi:cysteinyl-tRNA synthetase
VPFVRHWAHTGLVVTPGGDKMAHSMENFVTLADILDTYDPAEVRYYLTATHYRSPLPLIYDSPDGRRVRGIDEARAALGRLRRAVGIDELAPGPLWNTAVAEFEAAMDADFNTPDALAVIFDVAREVNRRRDAGDSASDIDDGRRTILHLLDILGLWLPRASGTQDIGPYVELALELRRKLREAKQWELADFVRDGLLERGIVVEDKPGGESAWRPKD